MNGFCTKRRDIYKLKGAAFSILNEHVKICKTKET